MLYLFDIHKRILQKDRGRHIPFFYVCAFHYHFEGTVIYELSKLSADISVNTVILQQHK